MAGFETIHLHVTRYITPARGAISFFLTQIGRAAKCFLHKRYKVFLPEQAVKMSFAETGDHAKFNKKHSTKVELYTISNTDQLVCFCGMCLEYGLL